MTRFISYLFFVCCTAILFSCQKELSVETYSSLTGAGSLWDSSGNCMPDSVHGTFYDGITPGSDTAYVEVQVNVTATGSYTISSDLQNGFQFFDSGFFSNTGINTIRLKPIGTPILPVSATFNISYDSSYCSFTINVHDSTGTGLGGKQQDSTGTGDPDAVGAWQFTTADGTFSGSIDTASIGIDSSIWKSGGKMLYIQGFTSTKDTTFHIITYLPSGSIATGSYTTQAVPPNAAGIFAYTLSSSGEVIYDALPDNNATASNVTINITSYDNTTNIIKGTFSGTADDSGGNATVNITNGSFTAKLTP